MCYHINVVSGSDITIRELAEMIKKITSYNYMNRRTFFKNSFKQISLFLIFFLPINTFVKSNKLQIKKLFKKYEGKTWILKSDDF